MPTYRNDLDQIPRYVPGRPIGEVMRELGVASAAKLASNECPEPPFPEVREVIARVVPELHRYPDSAGHDLTRSIARHHGVSPDTVWIGAGSSENLRSAALAVGGPGTSAVFGKPSFVMYGIATRIARAEPVEVSLDEDRAMDLDAMAGAIRSDTTIVYVCNPNNPTGAIRSGDDVEAFIDSVPDRVTVVVDEAYAEYVTDPRYRSMLSQATERPNVLVTRTFSKIYGLAGLRVGYAVGDPDLIAHLRIPQAPFTVNAVAQVAAVEAMHHEQRVIERRQRNAAGRDLLMGELRSRGLRVPDSQANFVYVEPDLDLDALVRDLLGLGIIVRPLGAGVRVTVGTPEENAAFLAAWDSAVSPGAQPTVPSG